MTSNNPFDLFKFWYECAQDTYNKNSLIGNAMTINTATKTGKPSARIVLLQSYSPEGFVFFTNKEGRKGQEIQENPQASFLFYWQLLSRQIRIEGVLEEIGDEASTAYFNTRPYLSRIGSWASKQSSVVKNPGDFQKAIEHYKALYPTDVPRPPYWVGYRLVPQYFEFWKNAQYRHHTRRVFQNHNGTWEKSLIYP